MPVALRIQERRGPLARLASQVIELDPSSSHCCTRDTQTFQSTMGHSKMNFMRGCPSWQRRACLFRTFFQAPYSILWIFFFRHSCGQNFLSPTSSQRALGDSRKLGKQTVLPKKELRLLTNLRILRPAYRESRKLD